MKGNIILNCGISGSGKSTWTRNKVFDDNTYIRCNRDDFRTIYGISNYYKRSDIGKLEKIVSFQEDALIIKLISENYNVIIDNTHLKKEYLERWIKAIELRDCTFNIKLFDCDLKEAKNRVIRRDFYKEYEDQITLDINVDLSKSPEVDYIDKHYQQYESIKKFINKEYSSLIIT